MRNFSARMEPVRLSGVLWPAASAVRSGVAYGPGPCHSTRGIAMKLKTIALAGATFMALGGPALAADGPYLGLEAGWSHPDDIRWSLPNFPGNRGRFGLGDNGLFGATVGWKWAN